MKKFLSTFVASEDGAISADWVVLTAAAMLLAVAVGNSLHSDTVTAGNQLASNVSAMATP